MGTLSSAGFASSTSAVGRPVRDGNGNWYMVARPTGATATVGVWKSTDDGANWTEQDTSGRPTNLTAGTTTSVAWIKSGTAIHIVYGGGNASGMTTTGYWRYATYEMSDSGGTADAFNIDESVLTPDWSGTGSTGTTGCDIAVLSGGNVRVICRIADYTTMGNSYLQLGITTRTGTATWSTPIKVNNNTDEAANQDTPRCVLGASDATHIIYAGGASRYGDTLSSADALAGRASLGTLNVYARPVVFTPSGGSATVGVVDGGDSFGHIAESSWPGTLTTETYDDTVAGNTTNLSRAVAWDGASGDNLYVLWASSADSDLYYDWVADGDTVTNSFTNTTEAEDAVTATGIWADVFDDGGGTVDLVYVFSNSGTLTSGSVSIATGGPSTQNLTGSLFTKAPTFPTGTVTAGTVALTGSLFTKAPTFGTGDVSQVTALTGTVYQQAPTFNAGTVTVGTVALTGSTYQQAPTFGTGTVAAGTVPLTGSLFSQAPTFNVGTVAEGAVNLTGTLFSQAPTFPQGTVDTGTVALTGTLFAQAPTFGTGTVGVGAQNLTGTTFTKAPTFNAGTVDTGTVALAGSLYSQAPTFPTGTVSLAGGPQALTGTTFTKAPTFATGTVAAGTVALAGSLFAQAPTFGTGSLEAGTVALTGTTFTQAPTFGTGTVDTGTVALTGSLFSKAPSFGTGTVSQEGDTQALTGTLFTKAPTFNAGTLVADQALTGSLYTQAPTFPTGTVSQGGAAQQDLTGTLFAQAPTFGTGTVDTTVALAGVLLERAPTFGTGTVGVGTAALGGVLFTPTVVFPVGAVSSAPSGRWQEGPVTVTSQEGPVMAGTAGGSLSYGRQE